MKKELEGYKIVLGVTGGIAAYKAVYLLRLLVKKGAHVQVVGTENSKHFIGHSTWESLSGRSPIYDTFTAKDPTKIEHIFLAQEVDAIIVAPATANIIGKMANGIADDMLSTILMAATAPVFIAPGMNSEMYNNPAYRRNEKLLASREKVYFIDPSSGELACGTSGKGRMSEPQEIADFVVSHFSCNEKNGIRWLVSGGGTKEYIDPVRYITNGSSGKTGLAIVHEAERSGGNVTFVGINVPQPENFRQRFIPTVTAKESAEVILKEVPDADIFVMSAAVADYSPLKSMKKIKKGDGDISIKLHRTTDILKSTVNLMKKGAVRVGFAAETENLIENARKKIEDKSLDMIVANIVDKTNDPFGARTNSVTIITSKETKELPSCDKSVIARNIVEMAIDLWRNKN
jgi:phosphopantothenoylcysteine decarboxylase / phosphopantothenate---cysteine ligase